MLAASGERNSWKDIDERRNGRAKSVKGFWEDM